MSGDTSRRRGDTLKVGEGDFARRPEEQPWVAGQRAEVVRRESNLKMEGEFEWKGREEQWDGVLRPHLRPVGEG